MLLLRKSRAPYADGLFPLTCASLYTLQSGSGPGLGQDLAAAAGRGGEDGGVGGSPMSRVGSGDVALIAENQAEAASHEWCSWSVEL